MIRRIALTILLGIIIAKIVSSRKYNVNRLKVGSMFTTNGYKKTGSKAKVLAIDKVDNTVVYSLRIEPLEEPFITKREGKKINISSIGSLPISEKTLKRWGINIIGWEKVTEEELKNYNEWQRVEGGYF